MNNKHKISTKNHPDSWMFCFDMRIYLNNLMDIGPNVVNLGSFAGAGSQERVRHFVRSGEGDCCRMAL